MRSLYVFGFLSVAALNSWAMSSISSGSLPELTGAAAKCDETKCTQRIEPTGECLHTGPADPCSPITCIQNWDVVPSCPPKASGGKECPTETAVGGAMQANFDIECNGKSGWAYKEIQKAGDCAPKIGANFRCLQQCSGGTAYAAVVFGGTICKGGAKLDPANPPAI